MANLFYYSVQTRLAHEVSGQYFGCFYVYVAKEFDPHSNPPSSNPRRIYIWFREIAENDDRGHPKYKSVLATLRKVARKKLQTGGLTQTQFREIQQLLNQSGPQYFSPLIYVIRSDLIAASRLLLVPTPANPLSQEIIIPDLGRDEFDIIRGV